MAVSIAPMRIVTYWSNLTCGHRRHGNCYDNASMESFWGSLKNELIHHRRNATRVEAEASIQEYMEIFF